MKALRDLLLVALIIGGLVGAYWLGRRSIEIDTVETVRVDTVFYQSPTAGPVVRRTVAVNVPRVLFAPASGQGEYRPGAPTEDDPTDGRRDSVRVELQVETRQYTDSTYRAQVSGPSIGGYRPQLDWIELYTRERTRTTVVQRPFRWEVGPAVGAWLSTDGRGAWIGIQAQRNFGRLSLSAAGGWATGGGVYGQVVVGVNLFRR